MKIVTPDTGATISSGGSLPNIAREGDSTAFLDLLLPVTVSGPVVVAGSSEVVPADPNVESENPLETSTCNPSCAAAPLLPPLHAATFVPIADGVSSEDTRIHSGSESLTQTEPGSASVPILIPPAFACENLLVSSQPITSGNSEPIHSQIAAPTISADSDVWSPSSADATRAPAGATDCNSKPCARPVVESFQKSGAAEAGAKILPSPDQLADSPRTHRSATLPEELPQTELAEKFAAVAAVTGKKDARSTPSLRSPGSPVKAGISSDAALASSTGTMAAGALARVQTPFANKSLESREMRVLAPDDARFFTSPSNVSSRVGDSLGDQAANDLTSGATLRNSDFSAELNENLPRLANSVSQALRTLHDRLESMVLRGRALLEFKLELDGGEEVSVRLQMRDGVIQTTFRSESSELREALRSQWNEFAQRASDRGMKVSLTAFESSDSFSAGDHPGRREDAATSGFLDGLSGDFSPLRARSGKRARHVNRSMISPGETRGLAVWA